MRAREHIVACIICITLALGFLDACGHPTDEPTLPDRPLCGLDLPASGPWHHYWRTDPSVGGVRDMVRDGDWLWVATPDDLVRLDLRTLDCTRFSHTDTEPEVPLSGIYALLLDPEGRLWAAAGLNGLARYDGQHWQVVLADVNAYGLAIDAAGNLWAEIGVGPTIAPFRYPGHEPPDDGQWEGERIYTRPPDNCDRWTATHSFAVGPRFHSPEECRLLAAWRERLASLAPPEGIAPWGENPPIAAESGDRLWVLARHLPDEPQPHDVLLSFDGQNWQVLPWPYGYTHVLVADEARGGVWVGTSEGLVFSDGQSLQKFLLLPGDMVPLGPPVYDLAVDGSDRLWASTERGLFLYDEASDAWQPTEINEWVLISADYQGGLWAVPHNRVGPVSHFDGEIWSHHPFPPGWPCLPRSILADAGGGLWLSSSDCALRGFNGEVWDEYDSGSRGDLLARGPEGEVYAVAWDGAVRRYDGTTWETLLPAAPPRRAQVIDLTIGQEGEVWLALNAVPSLLVYRDGEGVDALSLVDEPIRALLVDAQGDLWVGYSQGLLHYDGATWGRIESELPLSGTIAMAEDRRGRVWVGGWDGLIVYDPNRDAGRHQAGKLLGQSRWECALQ